ncbi:MAG: glycosyltransferase family 4 protein, partial [Fibrobacterota bacterium]
RTCDVKVCEALHISNCFEKAHNFDLIHNHFDFLPLCFSGRIGTPVLTTIHGFSSPRIIPVYRKYNDRVHYVSISDADRSDQLRYIKTIHHGIDLRQFTFSSQGGDYLLFMGRMHHDKGAREAIQIARESKRRLVMAGIIQDQNYFENEVKPHIDDKNVIYVGSVRPGERDRLLGGAYATLHSINFNEPFGLSVVESMACGTPVIAFNRGSMPEIIEHGLNGFLVKTVQEAAECVKRIDSLSRQKCRETAESRFSVQTMAQSYIQVYRQILQN